MAKTYDIPPAPPHNEGNTIAAWVLTVLTLVGCSVIGVGMAIASWGVIWAGIGTVVVGLIAGIVLALAGFGQQRKA